MDSLPVGNGGDGALFLYQPPGLGPALPTYYAAFPASPDLLASFRVDLALVDRGVGLGYRAGTVPQKAAPRTWNRPTFPALSWLQPTIGGLPLQSFFHCSQFFSLFILLDVTRRARTLLAQNGFRDVLFRPEPVDARIFLCAGIDATGRHLDLATQGCLDFRARLRRTLGLWAPYLAVFVAAVFSRLFIFNNQIYEIGGEQAGATPFNLLTTIPSSLWKVTVAAWAQVFRMPDLATDGPRTTLVYGAVALVTYGVVIAALFWKQALGGERSASKDAFWAMGLGVFILLVAGWPFWLTGVPVSLGYPANRATLSFMLGVSLLLSGLLSLLPNRLDWILLAVFVSLAAGRQFQWSNDFRRDWNAQKNLFWQMTWRAPGLATGTIVMVNEELAFYADNSLGAALNWIYAPDNHTDRVDYVLFYPTNRLGGALASLEPGQPVNYDYLAGQFEGNTSQVVAFYYAPPGCLRLLDPEIDPYNRLIPDETLLRDAAHLSTTAPVLDQSVARMPEIYAPEPAHNWCYYFERADLARQMEDWTQVADLGDKAFKLDDYPNDPLERFVFVEGYAHADKWQKALDYSNASYKVSKSYVGPLLCRLWERIERETPASAEKDAAVVEVKTLFVCNP